jgi:hypothetical protein
MDDDAMADLVFADPGSNRKASLSSPQRKKGERVMTRNPRITVEKLQERLWIAKLDGMPLKIGTTKAETIEKAHFAVAFGSPGLPKWRDF